MITNDSSEREDRDGSSFSSNNENGGSKQPVKKKRTRVGDLRKQNYEMPSSVRERNPYRSTDGGTSNSVPEQSSYSSPYAPREDRGYRGGDSNRDYNRGNDNRDYNNDRRDYNREPRPYNRDSSAGGREDSRSYNNNNNNYNRSGSGDNRRPYSDNQGYNRPRQSSSYNSGGNRNSSGDGRGGDGRTRYTNNPRSGGGDRRGPQGGGGSKRLVKPVKYKENIDPSEPIRLNKYLANAGVCSRREADSFITAGLVKVNGEVINQLGAKVARGDLVTYNEKPIRLESKVYVLLNKPKNCVTTSDDPQNRTTVMDLVKGACSERIYPVGRLDRNTTGVLLLTNDGDLASKLMHPKFKKKKIYQVTLDRDVAIEDMQAIADGIELDDGEIHADSIAYQAEDVLNVIGIEIHSGRNRIVRRIFEKLNYQVLRLDRVYFAGLTKKNLPRGRWRYLTEKEVNILRMGAFE